MNSKVQVHSRLNTTEDAVEIAALLFPPIPFLCFTHTSLLPHHMCLFIVFPVFLLPLGLNKQLLEGVVHSLGHLGGGIYQDEDQGSALQNGVADSEENRATTSKAC